MDALRDVSRSVLCRGACAGVFSKADRCDTIAIEREFQPVVSVDARIVLPA
jgi:hypothetical protein